MAATAAILDFVSIDYLTKACIDWYDFWQGTFCNRWSY
jgi:hypothetical protein